MADEEDHSTTETVDDPQQSQKNAQDTGSTPASQDDQPAQEQAEEDGKTAGQTSTESPDRSADGETGDLRAAIMAQLEKWAGACEGDAGTFDKEFMTPPVIKAARISAGKAGIVYTTCIDFQARVLANAAVTLKDSTVETKVIGTQAEAKARNITDAWHDGSANMTDRPTAGDIYLLASKDNTARFSHIGYIKSISNNDDGTEAWTTVDGGQGLAGKYDADGNVIQAGHEKLAEVNRSYDSTTNLITGEANQGGQPRWLKGWIDVDKLVQAKS
jgi:hypothetical protein